MFTLEESALLGRMLRVMGWLALCVTLGAAGCIVLRLTGVPHHINTHHAAPAAAHGHS